QVPVDPFMSAEARDDTAPSALRAVSADGHTWGWPRWILPQVWIARKDLAQSLGANRSAWSGEAFLEALAEAKTKTRSQVIVPNPFDSNALFEVMVASTEKNPLDESGRRAWTVEEMTKVLA